MTLCIVKKCVRTCLFVAAVGAVLLFIGTAVSARTELEWTSQFQGFRPKVTYWDDQATIIDKNIDRRTYTPNLTLQCEDRDVMRIRPDRKSERQLRIIFSTFPSHDAHFEVFDITDDGERHLGQIGGDKLEVPGDGFLYGGGHINSTFDVQRKFDVLDSSLSEVRQPFYGVGLTTKCNRQIVLYSDWEHGEPGSVDRARSRDLVVSVLEPGDSVEVLVFKEPDLYLIKDGRGLVGWARISGIDGTVTDLEGLRFVGD